MKLARLGTPGAVLVRTGLNVQSLIENRRSMRKDRRERDRGFKAPRNKRAWFGDDAGGRRKGDK